METPTLLRFGAFVVVMVSCAQPPDAELEIAAERLATARSADAAVFAPEVLTSAEAALSEAERLTNEERNYLGAIDAAGAAVTLADEALADATIEKKIATRRVERCFKELQGLMAIASSRGASAAQLASFDERTSAIEAIAAHGDLRTALDEGRKLKPELLAFEQRFRGTQH